MRRFPLAVNAPGELMLVLEDRPPDFQGEKMVADAQSWYGHHAQRFVAELVKHAPGGFVGASPKHSWPTAKRWLVHRVLR